MSQGLLMYSDFVSQHVPFPSIYVYLLSLLGFQTHAGYRLGYVITIVLFFIFFSNYLKYKFDLGILSGSIIFLFYSLTYSLFFGHMIMAENFIGLFCLLIAGICYKNDSFRFSFIEQLLISVSIFAIIICSVISIYPLSVFGLFLLFGFIKNGFISSVWFNKYIFIILSLLFTIFILCLHFLGILGDFIDLSFLFNLNYYSKYTGDYNSLNFLYSALINYLKFIIYAADSATFYPYERMLFDRLVILGILLCFIIQSKHKNLLYGFFLLFFTVLQKMRDGWLHEQSYYILSFFSILICLNYLYNCAKKSSDEANFTRTKLFSFLGLGIIGSIIFFTGVINIQIINNHPVGDDSYVYYIQKYSNSSDTLFATPLFARVYLDSQRLPATRFYVYPPWYADPMNYRQELVEDLLRNRPKIMVVDMGANV